ncbi:MAG: HD domain-containing protein [Eggerthellaceae bacterium]|nr:HD domain-containing protein [Eggerthellaceae bacterium]
MLNTPMTAAAAAIARRAHEGQLDKAGEPYINHPLTVAESMDTEEETCVALLHDVIEDSAFTAADLREAGMPDAVVEAVELLTHDEAVDYFDYVRAVRENPLAAKVKRADLEHNLDASRLRRRLTAIDMKRQSRYRVALDILDGKDGATGVGASGHVPPAPHAPARPRGAQPAEAAAAPCAPMQGDHA